jgi:putative transposase
MEAEWCAEVLKQAINEFGKPEIFNTDRTGGPARFAVYIQYLYPNPQIQSSKDCDAAMELDSKRAIDNIFMERIWKSVKYESDGRYLFEIV